MNISPIRFNLNNFNSSRINTVQKTANSAVYNDSYENIDKKTSDAIKASVLFTGNYGKTYNSSRMKKLQEFDEKYNLNFQNIDLLSQAFCSDSYLNGKIMNHKDSYQRLECIGDSVLNLCIVDMISKNIPEAQEGEISRRKSLIVCNNNISHWGKKLNLDTLTTSDKIINDKKYADMFEALLGAIYIDNGGAKQNGLKKVYEFLENNFKDDITLATSNYNALENHINY